MSSRQIKFDVGGKIYKVSSSLLNRHPNSLLTKQAVRIGRRIFSEIQIDCNAERFQYVLDYMKRKEEDDTIYIPTTVSKNALIKEIKHCGFDNVKPWRIVVEGRDSNTLEYFEETEAELETMLEEIRTCQIVVVGRDSFTLKYLQETRAELETMIEKTRTCQIEIEEVRDSTTLEYLQETEAEFETMVDERDLQETEAELEMMLERIRTCQFVVERRDSTTLQYLQETEAEFETMLKETEAEFETMLERIRFRKRKLLGIN